MIFMEDCKMQYELILYDPNYQIENPIYLTYYKPSQGEILMLINCRYVSWTVRFLFVFEYFKLMLENFCYMIF